MLKTENRGEETRKAAGPSLLYLTISTGRVRRSPRSEVSDDVIRALRPLVEAGGGAIKATGDYRVGITRDGRDALFTVTCDGIPVRTCGLAAEGPAAIWRALLALLPAAGDAGQPPSETPWLAVVIHENEANPYLYWLADFERCLAWAILEAEEPRPRGEDEQREGAARLPT